MSATVFNRAVSDNPENSKIRIHIVPKGELENREAGITQVLDEPALDSILANLDAEKQKMGANWPGLYIGIEHHIYDPNLSSQAAAWAKEFYKTKDGIDAVAEPTDVGADAIKNRRFKYTSFVVDPKDLEPLGGNRFRVLAIHTVGLTNLPNGKDLLRPINNRAGQSFKPLTQEQISSRIKNRAAERIAKLADEDARMTGRSWILSWTTVMNREPSLAAMAAGRSGPAVGRSGAREQVEDAAQFAGGELLRRAQNRKRPGLSANLTVIRNSFPRLARMANRDAAGWNCVADLEPVAHEAFMAMQTQPREGAAAAQPWGNFLDLVNDVAAEFPDLDPEGTWQKMRELYPGTFLKFVLSFEAPGDSQEAEDGDAEQLINRRASHSARRRL